METSFKSQTYFHILRQNIIIKNFVTPSTQPVIYLSINRQVIMHHFCQPYVRINWRKYTTATLDLVPISTYCLEFGCFFAT